MRVIDFEYRGRILYGFPLMSTDPLASLPHGREFRFVDTVDRLTAGESAVGKYTVRGDEDFLAGHFPGRPIMPGVILVEALAQLAGIVIQSDPKSYPLKDLRLCAMRNVKISGTAMPGDELEINVRHIRRLGNVVQAQGEVTVGGNTVLEAVIALSGNG